MKKHFLMRDSIRLTPAGWLYLLVTLGVGMASVNSGNNLLYLITAMLLSSLIFSGILSKLTLTGLSGNIAFPEFAFAGQKEEMVCSLDNHKSFFASYGVSLTSSVAEESLFFFSLLPQSRSEGTLSFLARKRGAFTCSLFVRTSFPFGLVEKKCFLCEKETIIFPALSIQHQAFQNLSSYLFGDNASPTKGGRGDFYQFRPYQEGEEAKSVFWKFYAKWGKAFVKEGEKETEPGWIIRLITEEEPHPQALEEALSLCSTLIFAYYKKGKPVGLWVNATFFPPSQNRENILEMLRFLALYQGEFATVPQTLLAPFEIRIRVGKQPIPHIESYAA